MPKSGITFIFSNVDFADIDLPFVISDNMLLRAASEAEVSMFSDHLVEAYGSASMWVVPFDHEPVEIEEENGIKRTTYSKSAKSRWWVIAFNGTNQGVHELSKIASLLSPKLHFGSTFLFSEPNQKGEKQGIMFGGHTQFELLANESRNKHQTVKIEELQKLTQYYKYLCSDQSNIKHVNYVLDLYSSTPSIRLNSSLLTLSLFSIIESLVAHKPRLTETLDSITHQIKNKLNLLSKRFDVELNHQEYFGEISHEKLWSKLYNLRSDIAHGQTYDFFGANTCLKSLENTNTFLDQVAKELIKLSISESDLITDLRAC